MLAICSVAAQRMYACGRENEWLDRGDAVRCGAMWSQLGDKVRFRELFGGKAKVKVVKVAVGDNDETKETDDDCNSRLQGRKNEYEELGSSSSIPAKREGDEMGPAPVLFRGTGCCSR